MPDPQSARRDGRGAVAASFVLMFMLGSLYAWSVFLDPLERELGASRSAISTVYSLATACFTFAMFLGLAPFRRWPPRRTAVATCILAAAAWALGAAADHMWQLALGFGALFGMANGIGYGLSLQLVQSAPIARRGLVTGFVVACYTAGPAALAPVFALGLDALGRRATFLLAAAAFVFVGALVAGLLRSARTPFPAGDRAPVDPSQRGQYLILWWSLLAVSAVGALVIAHAATIVQSVGGAAWQLAFGASLVAIGNGVGRILGGWLGDRWSVRAILAGMQSLCAVGLVWIACWTNVAADLAALGVVGLGYGCLAGAYPVIVGNLYGRENVSRVYGRLFTAWGLAAVCIPYLGGVAFDATGSYRAALAAVGGATLGAALLALRLPRAGLAPGGGREEPVAQRGQ